MEWQKISNGRMMREHSSGFFIVRPDEPQGWIPMECPHCTLLMRDATDASAYREFNCCSACAIKWAEPNRDRWCEGWRPAKEEVYEVAWNRTGGTYEPRL